MRQISVLVIGIAVIGALFGSGLAVGTFAINRTETIELDRVITIPVEVERLVEVERIVTVVVNRPVEVERIVTVVVDKIITLPSDSVVEKTVTRILNPRDRLDASTADTVSAKATPIPENLRFGDLPFREQSGWIYLDELGGYTLAFAESSYYSSEHKSDEIQSAQILAFCDKASAQPIVGVFVGSSSRLTPEVLVDFQFDSSQQVVQRWLTSKPEGPGSRMVVVPLDGAVDFLLEAVKAPGLSLTISTLDGERTTARWTLQGHDDPEHPILELLKFCGNI